MAITKITLLIIIKGTTGAKIAGSNPPASAIMLGTIHKTIALLIPTKNRTIIKTALTIGPVIHCK